MKFIRRRPRLKKSDGEWCTPKQVQLNKVLEDLDDDAAEPWHPKRKWPCKKLKGEHDFKEIKRDEFKWSPGPGKTIWIEFRCTACNKKKIEYKRGLEAGSEPPDCESGNKAGAVPVFPPNECGIIPGRKDTTLTITRS